jgi:hypothetical protein
MKVIKQFIYPDNIEFQNFSLINNGKINSSHQYDMTFQILDSFYLLDLYHKSFSKLQLIFIYEDLSSEKILIVGRVTSIDIINNEITFNAAGIVGSNIGLDIEREKNCKEATAYIRDIKIGKIFN